VLALYFELSRIKNTNTTIPLSKSPSLPSIFLVGEKVRDRVRDRVEDQLNDVVPVGVQLLCDCCAVAERLTDDEPQRYHKIEPLSLVKATTSTDTRSPVLYM